MQILAAPVDRRLGEAIDHLRSLEAGDAFDPRHAKAIVDAGLAPLAVPAAHGGLGADLARAVQVLARLGAVGGASALGFAMHVHVTGAAAESAGWPGALREELFREVVEQGALINAASTEEGGGSPARGAVPGTTATSTDAGAFRLRGEKTWTTWLPVLRFALVTARMAGELDPPAIGLFLVDLASDGVVRRPAFEALGMRGSASGRLVLEDVLVPADRLVLVRPANAPDPRGPAPGAWFSLAVAAVYLGIGEGARSDVARWALERRPGDGSTAVADLPTIRVRLGRMDAELRAARIVVEAIAERWSEGDAGARAALGPDIALAKLAATRAAVVATDEALRIAGGPGFLAGRLERAFRDARAGLINPPLEDVAYQEFARRVLDSAVAG